jgi:hypothetical protein
LADTQTPKTIPVSGHVQICVRQPVLDPALGAPFWAPARVPCWKKPGGIYPPASQPCPIPFVPTSLSLYPATLWAIRRRHQPTSRRRRISGQPTFCRLPLSRRVVCCCLTSPAESYATAAAVCSMHHAHLAATPPGTCSDDCLGKKIFNK